MSKFTTTCSHCFKQIDVLEEQRDKWIECSFCKKEFIAKGGRAKPQIPIQKELLKTSSNQLIPDGYNTAMFYVKFLKICGGIIIALGVVTGIITASSLPEYAGDGPRVLWFIMNVIGGILFALPCFVFAAFLNLFCGLAKNTAYLVHLNETQCELLNREG